MFGAAYLFCGAVRCLGWQLRMPLCCLVECDACWTTCTGTYVTRRVFAESARAGEEVFAGFGCARPYRASVCAWSACTQADGDSLRVHRAALPRTSAAAQAPSRHTTAVQSSLRPHPARVGCRAGLQHLAESGDQGDVRKHDTPGVDALGAQPAQQRRALAAAAANRRVVEALAAGILQVGEPGVGARVDLGAAVAELARAAGGAGRHLLLLALRGALASGARCAVAALYELSMSVVRMARWQGLMLSGGSWHVPMLQAPCAWQNTVCMSETVRGAAFKGAWQVLVDCVVHLLTISSCGMHARMRTPACHFL